MPSSGSATDEATGVSGGGDPRRHHGIYLSGTNLEDEVERRLVCAPEPGEAGLRGDGPRAGVTGLRAKGRQDSAATVQRHQQCQVTGSTKNTRVRRSQPTDSPGIVPDCKSFNRVGRVTALGAGAGEYVNATRAGGEPALGLLTLVVAR